MFLPVSKDLKLFSVKRSISFVTGAVLRAKEEETKSLSYWQDVSRSKTLCCRSLVSPQKSGRRAGSESCPPTFMHVPGMQAVLTDPTHKIIHFFKRALKSIPMA